MNFIKKSIDNSEKLYNNKKNKNRLILLLSRYYLGFLIIEDEQYLIKAYNVCAEYLNNNKSDLDVMLLTFFFSINLEDKDKIDYFNSIVSKYKKYLKINSQKTYAFYLFLQGFLKFQKGSIRGVNKYIKSLQNLDDDMAILYGVFLNTLIENVNRDIFTLLQPIKDNNFCKNIVLYIIFEKNFKFISFDKQDFKKYIKWALYNGVNIEKSIFRYEKSIPFDVNDYMFNYKVYESYNQDFILEHICKIYLENNIHNQYSYYFYKEAVNRQLNIDDLNINYIKACYKNNIENIGVYPIKQFLSQSKTDIELILYIYYIILTDDKYANIVLEQKDKILQWGAYFLEKGCVDTYYYPIYQYMLNYITENKQIEKKIIDILYKNNFLYEIYIDDDNGKIIHIKDYETDEIRQYPIFENKATIKAISPNFSYYVFSEENKDILKCNVIIKPVVKVFDNKYFNTLYKNGYTDEFVAINNVKYYLENESIKNINEEHLQTVLNFKNISEQFKMQILIKLANNYFYKEDYKNATSYYKKIIDKYIDNTFIDNVIKSYIICGEEEKTINIINKKIQLISDETLFFAVKNISKKGTFDKEIVNFVYTLLMDFKIDDNFINIVLNHYKGGLKQWIDLRNVLEQKDITIKQIDEYILKMTIYTNSMNKYSEKIFMQLYEKDIENHIIEDFLNFCVYESINGKYVFSQQFVYVMEYIFEQTNYKMIGYMLAHIYLKNDYFIEEKTHILQKIIQNMEQDEISFKIFENNKDKFKNFSYLYKNKPFIYNTSPDREVYIHYKNVSQQKFLSVKMKYFKFGMYIVTLPIFYGEDIEYYFVENTEGGSIATQKFFTTNTKNIIFDIDDEYFKINNAFIYTYEGNYNMAHQAIEQLILKDYNLKGKIL